ncbi:hypothetical protein [Streptomyces rhizosphaerihabitans]|uniref:hypothetical protein n=1 Tax=Streptomyces rhizosphaerihabitans TaxID=1266770 RepID=UPI0021C1C698|nr:hypothetical protein [Streptomyces rhizosphaerihabitans]MCT9011627.1 hypothetical protein [Streptomyces rhizosphaerihabitans]
MDEGIAALIAAGFGLVGAGVGGIAAAWGAKVGAERSAQATRQQVQDQAAAEHDLWLRQQRLDAYQNFQDTYGELARLISLGESEDLSAASDSARVMARWSARIDILGPPDVAELADRVVSALMTRLAAAHAVNRVDSNVDGDPGPEYVRMITQLYEESGVLPDAWSRFHSAFVEAAQQVMRSSGS